MNGLKGRALEALVVEKLKQAGYPSDCIVAGWGMRSACVDIAVFDQELRIPLMIVECKSSGSERLFQSAVNQVRRYASQSEYPLRAYVALATASGDVEFYDVTEAPRDGAVSLSQLAPSPVPSYDVIRTGAASRYADAQRRKERRYIGSLRIICWIIMPVLLLAVAILDALGWYSLSMERLILLGGLLLSLLIPAFGEIKLGELTLSRAGKEDSAQKRNGGEN